MIIIITIIVSLIIIGIIVNSNEKKRIQTLKNTIHETLVALYNDEANRLTAQTSNFKIIRRLNYAD